MSIALLVTAPLFSNASFLPPGLHSCFFQSSAEQHIQQRLCVVELALLEQFSWAPRYVPRIRARAIPSAPPARPVGRNGEERYWLENFILTEEEIQCVMPSDEDIEAACLVATNASAEERAVARQKYHEHMNRDFASTTQKNNWGASFLVLSLCLLVRSCT